jgi:O-antigen ligase
VPPKTTLERSLIWLYGLPVFFFPLSTAGAGIAAGLFLLFYLFSGGWRHWRRVRERPWWLPLLLMMLWTFAGLLWTSDLHDGFKVATTAAYGIYAFMGASLAWEERDLRIFLRLFLAGMTVNALLAILITEHILHWHYDPSMPFVGLSDHIWWSMALTHAILWLLWDIKAVWNLPRIVNLPLLLIFAGELALSPGRSGQLLFILLTPVAVFLLYRGAWRYWAMGGIAAVLALMTLSPFIQARLELGYQNLQQFAAHPASTDTSWGIRLATMWAGAEMFWQHPLFGVGTGDFAPAMEALQRAREVTATPGTRNDSAANSYLSEAAVLGLPGLLLLLWFLLPLSGEAWRGRSNPQGWFVLTYLGIFWIGGLYNTLIWGYADALGIAIFAGLPLHRSWSAAPR